MTLREALNECTLCALSNITVSDEHKIQVIDKIMSTPSTKVSKVKLCNIITWLLKKMGDKGEFLANEWHYPSKGELPKCDEKTQLIFYVNCYYEIDGKTITRKRTVLGNYQNSFLNDDIKLFVEKSKGYEDEHLPQDVIAWKKIVLPKESEYGV